jgi:hypothetical protein
MCDPTLEVLQVTWLVLDLKSFKDIHINGISIKLEWIFKKNLKRLISILSRVLEKYLEGGLEFGLIL